MKASLGGLLPPIVNELLVALAKPVLEAVSEYTPATPKVRFPNTATPLTAFTVEIMPAGVELIVTAAVEDTGFPLESCTCTITAGDSAVPAAPFDGWIANASLAGPEGADDVTHTAPDGMSARNVLYGTARPCGNWLG